MKLNKKDNKNQSLIHKIVTVLKLTEKDVQVIIQEKRLISLEHGHH